MTRWILSYTVEATNQSGAFTVENDSMSRGIAQRYAADHVLRTGGAGPELLSPNGQ
jgi:hypothetical protein